MVHFPKLFEPGRIGKLNLKNRIIMPPIGTHYTDEKGEITDRMLAYYRERARGGCGLVIVQSSYFRAGGYPGRLLIGEDRCIPGLKRLVAGIHEEGAKAGIEITLHRGRRDHIDPATASETVHPETGIKVRAMEIAELKKLVKDSGEASRRVKEAGFDCLMIHGGSGYLIPEFLSPRLNRRTDEYGGNVEKRARLALEVLLAIRKNVGMEYPILYRLSVDERMAGGFCINDAITVCRLLEEVGADCIDVTSGAAETNQWVTPNILMPRALNASFSQALKEKLKIPISITGGINDPYLAEEILKGGKADFIDLGRPLIADPEFPKKAMEGKAQEIRKCILCLRCSEAVMKPPTGPLICTVNPAVGKEEEFEQRLHSAGKKKRVLILGGGPAGMQAAIIAAQRGNEVTLWEKENRLGGQLHLALLPPGKSEIISVIDSLERQLSKMKVSVHLHQEATVEEVLHCSPDVVIFAVGSKPRLPNIPGIEKNRVFHVIDVLTGKVEVGENLIMVGGGFIGCEAAEFLHEKGKKVTIVEVLPKLVSETYYTYSKTIVDRLKERGIETFTSVQSEKITEKGMEIVTQNGQTIALYADTILCATGSVAEKTLSNLLRGKVKELYEIGDCREVRRIYEAISEGAEAGLRI
jgi:2,4-dienoyl-CoA reductase-like NADH-dependent reductase (Old Yellow Enzyme family)/thioredoxin reductase